MFRAASLVLILLVLLCACTNSPDVITKNTATPDLQPIEEKPKVSEKLKAWEEADEFLVLNLNNKATNIYDINGNLLKTVYALCYDDGYYTKDSILQFYFRHSDGSFVYRAFSFETGDFITDQLSDKELKVYKKYYLILNDKKSWDIYSNAGKLLESISEKQYGEDYFENKYGESRDKALCVYKNYYLIEKNNSSLDVYSNAGIFLENIPGKYEEDEDGLVCWPDFDYFNNKYQENNEYDTYYDRDYKTVAAIKQKIGLKSEERLCGFNDSFSLINWNGEYKLFCFYLNDFVDLNIPSGYDLVNISVDQNTNYAIVEFVDVVEYDPEKNFNTVIDMFGNIRFTYFNRKNCTISDFENNFIILNRGSYRGIADLDGNWIVKVVNDREYSEDTEEYDAYQEDSLDEEDLEKLVLESNQRNFSREEIIDKSEYELSILRNGIYALSGKIFTVNMKIKEYFESKDWYKGISADDTVIKEKFNKYQASNLALIRQIEKERGYR